MVAKRLVLTLTLLVAALPASALGTRATQLLNVMFTQGGFGFGFPPYAADPFTCNTLTKRTTYYNTTSNTPLYCNGTIWTGLGGASLSGANDWTGTNQFTSTVKVYQTATHTGNNWLGLAHDGTNGSISIGAGGLGVVSGATQMINITTTGTTIGWNTTQAASCVAIGPSMACSNNNAIMIGGTITASPGNPSITMGTLTTGAVNSFVAGSGTSIMNNVYFGKGITNATATDYALRGTGGTGSDNPGGALILAPGIGTGVAVGGPLTLNRNLVTTTGSSAQTQAPSYVSCPTKTLSNTSATAQTVATITTTTTSGGAISMFYTVVASNGTLVDADSGEAQTAWNNNAGTVAATMAASVGGANSAASGTLASVPTATVATNVISVKLTPTWTVIVPTLVTSFVTFQVNGVNTIACQ